MKRAVVPGKVLKDELDAIGITSSEFACQIDVPPNRVCQSARKIDPLSARNFDPVCCEDFGLTRRSGSCDEGGSDQNPGRQARFLKRQDSLPVSTISQ